MTNVLSAGTNVSYVTRFKESGRKEPVDYLSFVLNRDSFAATVENVFHCSFLVKEGKVSARR